MRSILLRLAILLACATPALAHRDLETGTFLTRDPAGFVDGPNQYTYVVQNPWTHFDPEGLAMDLGNGIQIHTDNDGHMTIVRGTDPTSGGRELVNPTERAVAEVVINHGDAKSMQNLENVERGRPQSQQSWEVAVAMKAVADPEAADRAFSMAGASMVEPGQRGPAIGRGPITPDVAPAPAPLEPSPSAQKTQLQTNREVGAAFQAQVAAQAATTQTGVVQELTVVTPSGVKVRIDLAGRNATTGTVELTEAKSSATAPLTKAQKQAFPEIQQAGATVVGKGKPGFPTGTVIPPTTVNVVRPPEKQPDPPPGG